ncbi:Septum site-determining protein MinD [Thalassoglobus neptunius]|uniref:Septum site-determining protein MinD n=1 Tax=Thalassoglobus neptunius TaxID=1938619 RepID=A0A5C5X437_9PLAN|nr:AAA family ATPase [Thalassoglobus neptunius]TWT57746.1 Septum site-determining protein MinD [Thalassoglobus neptunius]
MNNVVRLAIVDPRDGSRTTIKNLLLGIDSVWLEAECSRYEFFSDIITQTQPDIALIALDADPQQGLATIAEVRQESPECHVLVVSSSQEGSLILQAMRNGAKEFLHSPLNLDDFMAALDRIQNVNGNRDGKSKSTRVITVIGASGGVGCTSLAVNLGCALASNVENSVAIIDLDLALGDADVWLDIIPDYTILDVAENISRLDFSMLKRSLTQHASGAFLLPRPVHMDHSAPLTPDELRRVIALLKATFTHLIVDVSKSFSQLDMAAMEIADQILVVTQLDLPCLRNVVRINQFLDEHELSSKVQIIVNRVGLGESQISLNKALDTIGREVFWQIPNEYAAIIESRNNGVPLLTEFPKAKITKAIEQLAQKIDDSLNGDGVPKPPEKKKSGLFSFLK